MMKTLLTITFLSFICLASAQDPGPTGGSFTNACLTTGDLIWTNPGTTNTILIFAKATSAITVGLPSNNISTYTANSIMGSGTPYQNDASAFCVYKGNGSSVSLSSLTSGTTYHFIIFNATGTTYSTAATFSGSALSAPGDVSGLTATPASGKATVTWTNPSTCFDEIMIVAKEAASISGSASGDGSAYSTNQNFGSGTSFDGGFVIYKGNSSGQDVNALTNGSTYFFKIFSRKGTVWSTGVETSTVIFIPPASAGAFSATCFSNGNVSWTNPSSIYNIVVFAKANNAITIGSPTNNESSYNGNSVFGSGTAYQNDAAAFCIYKGNGTSTSITNLSAGVTYHFLIFNIDAATYSASNTFNGSSLNVPPNVTGFGSTPGDSQINLAWTNPSTCFDDFLIVAKAGSAVTATPSGDGSSYTSNNNLGTGTAILPNEFVVFKGSGTSVNVTGLTNGTTYHFKIFTRKGTAWSLGVIDSDSPSDTTPPNVITLFPANGATDVSLNTNLVITFNEQILNVGNNSNSDNRIIIRNPNNSIHETIDPQAAGRITLSSGNTVATILITNPLAININYRVEVGNKVFKDVANNFFNGTNGATWNFTTINFIVNAGSAKTICKGDSILLGGIPTVMGGTGFYNYSWDTDPATGVFSNQSNPIVKPTASTTYKVTVTDSQTPTPNQQTSSVTITVNPVENPANLEIKVNPLAAFNKTYLQTDPKVQLSYLINGAPGAYPGQTRFEGPGVNSTDFNKYFYPNAANIGENVIKLIYQNSSGCFTQITDTIRVVTQNGLMAGLDPLYCNTNTTDLLVVNELSEVPDGVTTYYGYRYTYLSNPTPVTLYNDDAPYPLLGSQITLPLAFSITNRDITINPGYMNAGYKYFVTHYKIEYLYRPSAIAPIDVYYKYDDYALRTYFLVAEKPTLTLNIADKYCANEGLVELTKDAFPAGGAFKVNNSNVGLDIGVVTSLKTGDPALISGDPYLPTNITITYNYTNAQGCPNSISKPATIYRLPNLDFTLSNGCEGDTITFTPQINSANNIATYSWQWDDKSSDENINGASLNPIDHIYPIPANYNVSLNYITNTTKPCKSSITKPLRIGEIPNVNFTWQNVCQGSNTNFLGVATGLGSSTVTSFNWDFEGSGYTPLTFNPNHLYATTGARQVKMKVITSKDCSNTIEKTVYVVPTKTTQNIPYLEDFNSSDGAWVVGTSNDNPSSWTWDIPAGFKLNGDASGNGKAWFTNSNAVPNLHYNLNEKSWVHTPCFDLSSIGRPVLSLDIKSLSQNGLDGAVIQMDSTSKTNSENTWITIGVPDETPNWYNQSGLPGNPGIQQLKQYGWSGYADTTAWRNALIPLDKYLPKNSVNRQKVRFRIAFGSQGSNQGKELDGFSFDNFKISERNRIVLLELFTNKSNTALNSAINLFALKPISFDTKDEIIKIEYHLSMPEMDSLNMSNTADQNSRAAYYGITSTPEIRIDADYRSTPIPLWIQDVFSQKSLKNAPISIDTIFIKDNISDKLTVHTEFTAEENIPANTILQIAVVEKAVNSENQTYYYVLRKLLPSASGTKFEDAIIAGSTFEVEKSWVLEKSYFKDINKLAIIVFLQNEVSKEIYQAKILKELNYYPNIITGTEPLQADQIKLYPNPANQSITIELPQTARKQIPIKIYNVNWLEVYNNTMFEQGSRSKIISTKDLASGVYIIKIETDKGVVRKKIMVVH